MNNRQGILKLMQQTSKYDIKRQTVFAWEVNVLIQYSMKTQGASKETRTLFYIFRNNKNILAKFSADKLFLKAQ